MLTRRAFAALPVAALAACQTTAPLGPDTAIDTIRVDVSRLVELGVGPRTATIKAQLEQELARLFAGNRRAGGATLVVAARGLTLATYVGGDVDDGATSDYFESLVTVAERGGAVRARYPVLSLNGAGDSGFWFDPGIDERRVARLVANHAIWIRRLVVG